MHFVIRSILILGLAHGAALMVALTQQPVALWSLASLLPAAQAQQADAQPVQAQHLAVLAPAAPVRRPSLALVDAVAPDWLESQAVFYRLAYAQDQEPRAYGQARWAAPPAQMVTARARVKLGQVVNRINWGNFDERLLVKLELEDFSQVYDTPTTSHGQVVLRGILFSNGQFVAQYSFSLARPVQGTNGLGTVRALLESTEVLLDDLALWLERSANLHIATRDNPASRATLSATAPVGALPLQSSARGTRPNSGATAE